MEIEKVVKRTENMKVVPAGTFTEHVVYKVGEQEFTKLFDAERYLHKKTMWDIMDAIPKITGDDFDFLDEHYVYYYLTTEEQKKALEDRLDVTNPNFLDAVELPNWILMHSIEVYKCGDYDREFTVKNSNIDELKALIEALSRKE